MSRRSRAEAGRARQQATSAAAFAPHALTIRPRHLEVDGD
jgi:hypothetical protein